MQSAFFTSYSKSVRPSVCKYVVLTELHSLLASDSSVGGSGVTTDPADPAMRGARGLMGAQNYGINFFHCKFNTAILCGRACTDGFVATVEISRIHTT